MPAHQAEGKPPAPAIQPPDIREKGGPRNGQPQYSDRRLFVGLQAFGGCLDSRPLAQALSSAGVEGVLYEEAGDSRGVAVLALAEDPDYFVAKMRDVLNKGPFAALAPKTEFSMLGRTYAIGYEPNLEDWLLHKPRRTVLDPAKPWAVWYPLRRTGAFAQLAHEEQMKVLREHSQIGRAYGDADYAHDVRLSCFGLDKNDCDFVIGLVGKDLYPLSALVQAMRATKQTSTYIERMGPFFVGKAVWQSPPSRSSP